VRLVVADTGPINYLILIGHIDLIPTLFERVIIPRAVLVELASPKAPPVIRQWMSAPPIWLEPRDVEDQSHDPSLDNIDVGERAAIRLAISLDADLLLMDDRKAVSAAEGKGLRVTAPWVSSTWRPNRIWWILPKRWKIWSAPISGDPKPCSPSFVKNTRKRGHDGLSSDYRCPCSASNRGCRRKDTTPICRVLRPTFETRTRGLLTAALFGLFSTAVRNTGSNGMITNIGKFPTICVRFLILTNERLLR
jgi:predicted nucleic acid-binding protein